MTNRMNVVNCARAVQDAETRLDAAKHDLAVCEKGIRMDKYQIERAIEEGGGKPNATSRFYEDELNRAEADLVYYKDAVTEAEMSLKRAKDAFDRARVEFENADTSSPDYWL